MIRLKNLEITFRKTEKNYQKKFFPKGAPPPKAPNGNLERPRPPAQNIFLARFPSPPPQHNVRKI